MKIHKSGKLLVVLSSQNPLIIPLPGWKISGKKAERLFNIELAPPESQEQMLLDKRIRHLVSEDGEDCGWVINSEGNWISEPINHVEKYLKALGYKATDIPLLLGSNIAQCWRIVNMPFKDEYPKDRQWNRNAAKLRYRPSLNTDNLNFPTWTKVLNHIGSSLTSVLPANEWCVANNIINGADWLKCWIASLLQEPLQPLPYIFLYGDQDSGKSILHEAISLLMTTGVARADQALVSPAGFNGELENAVLCVIEETDLRTQKLAYNRIKDWVTSRNISIHKKGKQPYMIPNSTHYIQTSNSHLYCPVFPGDTRITLINVQPIDQDKIIPKKELITLLETEAPDFLASVLNLEIPKSSGRLNIPCVTTHEKLAVSEANKSLLEQFLDEKCFYIKGAVTKYSDFYERFLEWLDPTLHAQFGRNRVARDMPPKFPKGRLVSTSQIYVGNLSFDKDVKVTSNIAWVVNTKGELHQLVGEANV